MKINEFKKNIGKVVKFNPAPVRRTIDFQDLGFFPYNEWIIEAINEKERVVEFRNKRTDHSFRLGFDYIREYQRPDILDLRCNIIVTEKNEEPGIKWGKVIIEPRFHDLE